jgi:hypothetical protein
VAFGICCKHGRPLSPLLSSGHRITSGRSSSITDCAGSAASRFYRIVCARKETRARSFSSLASDTHVCLKLTIVHFWRIWCARRHIQLELPSSNVAPFTWNTSDDAITFEKIIRSFRITVKWDYLCSRSIVRYYVLQERVDIFKSGSWRLVPPPTRTHHTVDLLRTHRWFR